MAEDDVHVRVLLRAAAGAAVFPEQQLVRSSRLVARCSAKRPASVDAWTLDMGKFKVKEEEEVNARDELSPDAVHYFVDIGIGRYETLPSAALLPGVLRAADAFEATDEWMGEFRRIVEKCSYLNVSIVPLLRALLTSTSRRFARRLCGAAWLPAVIEVMEIEVDRELLEVLDSLADVYDCFFMDGLRARLAGGVTTATDAATAAEVCEKHRHCLLTLLGAAYDAGNVALSASVAQHMLRRFGCQGVRVLISQRTSDRLIEEEGDPESCSPPPPFWVRTALADAARPLLLGNKEKAPEFIWRAVSMISDFAEEEPKKVSEEAAVGSLLLVVEREDDPVWWVALIPALSRLLEESSGTKKKAWADLAAGLLQRRGFREPAADLLHRIGDMRPGLVDEAFARRVLDVLAADVLAADDDVVDVAQRDYVIKELVRAWDVDATAASGRPQLERALLLAGAPAARAAVQEKLGQLLY